MDRLTKQHRSWNMSRIRSCDTKPEQIVRSLLHRLGFRFRKNSGKRVFGNPDIVLRRYRTLIFVHGCFWHRHKGCRFAYTPKSRIEFWSRKFNANIKRDAVVKKHVAREGWRVIVVWECELARLGRLQSKLARLRARPTDQSAARGCL